MKLIKYTKDQRYCLGNQKRALSWSDGQELHLLRFEIHNHHGLPQDMEAIQVFNSEIFPSLEDVSGRCRLFGEC